MNLSNTTLSPAEELANKPDSSTTTDDLRTTLLLVGIVIVVIHIGILICAKFKLKTKSNETFLLLGLCLCDVFTGIVVATLSRLAHGDISLNTCRVTHVLVPTICCAFVYHFLFCLVHTVLELRDAATAMHDPDSIGSPEKKMNGCIMLVFVYVAWFISLVACSLPVVGDTTVTRRGVCTPETLFPAYWRLFIVYETALYISPLVVANCIFVMLARKLRTLLHEQDSAVQVIRSSNTPRFNRDRKTSVTPGSSHVDYGQQRSWETSVIAKWTNIVNARKATDVKSTPSLVRNKRFATPGRMKDDRRLWKKLQETVFSQNWRQLSIKDEMSDVVIEVPSTNQHFQKAEQKHRLSVHTEPISERNSTISKDFQEDIVAHVDFSALRRKCLNLFILLMTVNVTSVFRIILMIGYIRPYSGLQNGWLLVLALTSGSVANAAIYATRWPPCKAFLKDLYSALTYMR